MYKIAALLNFIIAAGHIICLPWLKETFELCGMEPTREALASIGAPMPYIVSIMVAIMFTIIGLYALSAAGTIRKLPYWKWVIFVCILVFSVRYAMGLVLMTTGLHYNNMEVASTAISFAMAFFLTLGAVNDFKRGR